MHILLKILSGLSFAKNLSAFEKELIANIINTVPGDQAYLSDAAKNKILYNLKLLIDHQGLGAGLEALWQQQKNIHFVLGNPQEFNITKKGRFELMYSESRKLRGNEEYLISQKILNKHGKARYETFSPNDAHGQYVDERAAKKIKCLFCSAKEIFPNQVHLPRMFGQNTDWETEFIYGVNFGNVGRSHYTIWSRPLFKQIYHGLKTLYWLDAHCSKLFDPDFSTIFNGLEAGNTIMHFHFQTFQEKLPIFKEKKAQNIFSGSKIQRLTNWPLPAFKISYGSQITDKLEKLSALDRLISAWLSLAPENTLNLLAQQDKNGQTHIIFIPRSALRQNISLLPNKPAGSEVGGRLTIETLEAFNTLRALSEKDIAKSLSEVAPDNEMINSLVQKIKRIYLG